MKLYFLSSEPCALFLNDLYYGVTDRFERFIELSLSDRIYARFCPQGALPVGFFLDEQLLQTPPKECDVYILKDGVAVYVKNFPPSDFTLQVLAQKREADMLVTLYKQGVTQLSVQSDLGYFNANLPPSFSQCELELKGEFCFVKTADTLAVYSKKAELLFMEKVLSYSFEQDTLTAVLPLSDHLKRFADGVWTFTQAGVARKSFTIRQAEETLPCKTALIPYAFLESVLIGADYTVFLSDELKPNADKIKGFFGDFTSVLLCEQENVCGIIKRKSENLFEAVYYTLTMENEKISDISPCLTP